MEPHYPMTNITGGYDHQGLYCDFLLPYLPTKDYQDYLQTCVIFYFGGQFLVEIWERPYVLVYVWQAHNVYFKQTQYSDIHHL